MMLGAPLFLLLLLSLGFVSSSSPNAPPHDEEELGISVSNAVWDIVQRISANKEWNVDNVRILNIHSKNAKFTKATDYELNIKIGDQILPTKFVDEIPKWEHLGDLENFSQDQDHQETISKVLWSSKSLQSVLAPFQLNGPLDLSFKSSKTPQDSSQENEQIISLNVTFGSSVEVEGAHEVTLAHPVELSLPINRTSLLQSLATSKVSYGESRIHTLGQEDNALLSIHIIGSAIVASITGLNLSLDTSQVNPEPSFLNLLYKGDHEVSSSTLEMLDKASAWPFPLLNISDPSLLLVENIMEDTSNYVNSCTILHAKVTASTFVRFEFEIERTLDKEDFDPALWPDWRTRPSVKRYSYQVIARIKDNSLIPMSVKSLKYYENIESNNWLDVSSNVSYAGFSGYFVPSSPMTLDTF